MTGQHTTDNIRKMALELERVNAAGATRQDIVDVLKLFQAEARRR